MKLLLVHPKNMVSFLSLLVMVAGIVGVPTVLVLSAMDARKMLRVVNANLFQLNRNLAHNRSSLLEAANALSDKADKILEKGMAQSDSIQKSVLETKELAASAEKYAILASHDASWLVTKLGDVDGTVTLLRDVSGHDGMKLDAILKGLSTKAKPEAKTKSEKA